MTLERRWTEDTIAAISTPLGESGIGIVRLSGELAVSIVHSLFASSSGRDIRRSCARVFHGTVVEDGETLDEVLVHVMRAPHSYTCEDVVEINCHGGPGPLQAVLALAVKCGARLAAPGEFTRRAFLNGRIDLVQAEAVIDRIQARTRAGLRAASAAAGGVLSRAVHDMQVLLADALARIEAAVDFPEEDLPELVDAGFFEHLGSLRERMQALLDTSEAGRLYREGARMAIAGRPNVGKSSLFNALLRDTRAIVTSIPGTTRDTLEETITLRGVPVRLTDTAGVREARDEVEQIGVERARNVLRTADVLLMLVDAAAPDEHEDQRLAEEIGALDIPAVLVLNKIDLVQSPEFPAWAKQFKARCALSCATLEGLKQLEDVLGGVLLGSAAVAPEQALVSRIHQQDSLRRAVSALERVLANRGASPEFLSIDLRDGLDALGEITGETTPDDILDRIFSAFCIGK